MSYDVVKITVPEDGEYYTSVCSSEITIKRGNIIDPRWILRMDGEVVDKSKHRHALFNTYNIRVINRS